jgi:protein-S-isoprenylcysteine O-methyltransferase Ste14
MIQFMYMYTTTDIVLAIGICLVWISVWRHSYTIDRGLLQASGKRPNDRRLVRYSGGLIVLLTIFYTIIYNRIDISFWGLVDSSNFIQSVSLWPIRIFALSSLLIGAVLIMKSREKLGMLTSREVIFALNDDKSKKVHDGVYTNMNHPMYVGIVLVTLSSLILLPTVLGACILLGVYFCLWMKTRVENNISN